MSHSHSVTIWTKTDISCIYRSIPEEIITEQRDPKDELSIEISERAASRPRKLLLCVDCRYVQLYNGSLIVNDVRAEDAGIYKCVGYTNSGPVQTFAVQLVLARELILYTV